MAREATVRDMIEFIKNPPDEKLIKKRVCMETFRPLYEYNGVIYTMEFAQDSRGLERFINEETMDMTENEFKNYIRKKEGIL